MGIIKEDIRKILHTDLPWEALYHSTVLVTGGTGLIMTYLTYALLALNETGADIQIILICRSEHKVKKKYGAVMDRPYFHIIYADVCEAVTLEEKIDYIIHAASMAVPAMFVTKPVETIRANVTGTDHMLRLARKNQVRGFLFVSSCNVYGKDLPREPVCESYSGSVDFNDIRSCYCEAKRMGEMLCRSYYLEYQVPAVIVRPVYIYSPETNDKTLTAFTDFMNAVLKGEDLVLHSDGSAVRSFCYAGDCVTAMFTALLKGKAGETYNIANSTQAVSVRRLAQIFAEQSKGRSGITYDIRKDDLHKPLSDVFMLDTDKLEQLGWHPQTGIEEGVARTIAGWLEQEDLYPEQENLPEINGWKITGKGMAEK